MIERREFKSLEEQLQILKERGLTINDDAIASRYLLTNNYYNIINGYSKYFQTTHDKFISGANFDEVSRLYFFDKEIKQIMLNAILSAEHHLKSALAYRFAEAYPNRRYAYLNVECYKESSILDIVYTISKISRLIKKNNRYKESSIHHYIANYDDIPIWVLVDYLEFGDIQSMIFALPKSIQNKIAKDMAEFLMNNLGTDELTLPPETLNSYIKNIHEARNVCAHGNRLLDFQARGTDVYFEPLHKKYGISEDDKRQSAYTVMLSLQCFITPIEYSILYNSIRKRTKSLATKLHSISIDNISQHLGFPIGWQTEPAIQHPN